MATAAKLISSVIANSVIANAINADFCKVSASPQSVAMIAGNELPDANKLAPIRQARCR